MGNTPTAPLFWELSTTAFVEDAGVAKIWNMSSEFLDFLTSGEGFTVTSQYKKFLTATNNVSLFLSIQSTFLNFLLILNLLLDKEFRTWQFYPITFQIFCDLIGAGIANTVYELKNGYDKLFGDIKLEIFTFDLSINEVDLFHASAEFWMCFLTYSRVYLNEYSTGVSVCATGLIRYLLVCRPTMIVKDVIYRRIAIAMTLLVICAVGAITLDFQFNGLYFSDGLFKKFPKSLISCGGPSREHIGNVDDSLMLSSITSMMHRFYIEHRKHWWIFDVTSMFHPCFQCVLHWNQRCSVY